MNQDTLVRAVDLPVRLNHRKKLLWSLIGEFVQLGDAHGVHDMVVEIIGIETVEKELLK